MDGRETDLVADAAAVRQFLSFLDHVGIDPGALGAADLGLALRDAAAPTLISARVIVELMERGAEVAQQPDLGITFAEWLNPRGFGPLSFVADHCPSVARQFRLMRRFIPVANASLAFEDVVEGERVALVCRLHPSLRPRGHQFMEGNVALLVRTVRRMLGDDWAPESVEIGHAAPLTIATQKRFFRCAVNYDCDRYAVSMKADDFTRRLAETDSDILAFLERHLAERQSSWPTDLRGQVEQLVAAQLAGGGANAGHIARMMAMSPSTMRRRLTGHGTSFGEILAYVRMQIVREHLAQAEPAPLAQLAHRLGFSEPSAACRFIKARFGETARALAIASGGTGNKSGSAARDTWTIRRRGSR